MVDTQEDLLTTLTFFKKWCRLHNDFPFKPRLEKASATDVWCRYLRHLKRNREDEEELMKNVPGWEVGTYYGTPVYKTLPKDSLEGKYSAHEYTAHIKPSQQKAYYHFEFYEW